MPNDLVTQFELQKYKNALWVSCVNILSSSKDKDWVNRIDYKYTQTFFPIPDHTLFVCHTSKDGTLETFTTDEIVELPENLFTIQLQQQSYSNAGAERTIKRVVASFFKLYGIMKVDLHIVKRPIKSQGDVLLSVAVINQEIKVKT